MTAEGFVLDKDTCGGSGSSSEQAVLAKEEIIYLNIVTHFVSYTNGCKHSTSESVSDCHGQVH